MWWHFDIEYQRQIKNKIRIVTSFKNVLSGEHYLYLVKHYLFATLMLGLVFPTVLGFSRETEYI